MGGNRWGMDTTRLSPITISNCNWTLGYSDKGVRPSSCWREVVADESLDEVEMKRFIDLIPTKMVGYNQTPIILRLRIL